MKFILPLLILASFNVMADATEKKGAAAWDKTKKVINTTADKIDSGTRTVIKKAKAKMNEEKAENKEEKNDLLAD